MRASLFVTVLSGGESIDPAAQTLFDAFVTAGVPASASRRSAYNKYIKALKAADVWDDLDFDHLYAAHAREAAVINIVNPGTYNALEVAGAGTLTFTVDRGFTSDGANSYLNTQFNCAAGGIKFLLDDAHVNLWSRSAAGINGDVPLGTTAGSAGVRFSPRNASDLAFVQMNSINNDTIASSDGSGGFIFQRTSSAGGNLYRNGASLGTYAEPSTAVSNVALFVLAFNQSGTPVSFSAREIAAAGAGRSLSAEKALAFHNARAAYMQAVGAA